MEEYKKSIATIENLAFERTHIKTHFIKPGENIIEIIKRYVAPFYQEGDWIVLSEKVVSVCQNNIRHISSVKAGWLAKFVVKGVKKYPDDVGFSKPEKMQLVIERAGWWRIFPAMLLGSLGKIVGVRGIFWIIVGNRNAEIDGFNPNGMNFYAENAALPPNDPEKVCNQITKLLKIPAVVIDGNNINVKIIAKSSSLNTNKDIIRKILIDNPMGQNDELTPIILIRKLEK